MKQKITVFLVLTALIIVSNISAGGSQEEAEEKGKVQIEVYYPVAVDAPIAKILDGYIEEFEAQNPDITVKPVYSGGYGDVKTALQTTIEGGGKPPAMAVLLATDLYDLYNAGYIEALDSYLDSIANSEAYLDDFYGSFLENSLHDGKIWSLPFQRSAVVLYFNETLLEDKGLARPDSWKTLGQTASKLTEREGGEVTRWGIEWPSGWPYWLFQPLAIGNGRNIVGESDTEVYFDHPKVIEAIEYYNSLSAQYEAMPAGVQASWGAAPSNFASGNTAMIVHSTGSLNGILNQADFEVGVMPIPAKKKGEFASVPGGGNLYIMEGASEAKKEAAFQFARFLTEPERVADFSINTGYIATRKSAYETGAMEKYMKEVPQAKETRDALQYAGKELAVQNLGAVRNSFHKYLQEAFNGNMSPQEAMSTAQEEAEEAFEDFR
jgi:sn-glycerol 3-phosphate transport system substrate-binding protein